MTIRAWLKSLQKLTQQARGLVLRCFSKSAAQRCPDFAPPPPETGTDLTVQLPGRSVRILCSDTLQVAQNYQAWIAPLMNLSGLVTVAALQKAADALPGFQPSGQRIFPLNPYQQALQDRVAGAELVHFGVAESQTSLAWLSHLAGLDKSLETEPAVIVIHDQEAKLK